MLIPIVAVLTVAAVAAWSVHKDRQEDNLLRRDFPSEDRGSGAT